MEEYKFVPTEEDRKSAIEMADRYFVHTFDVSNVDCFYSGFYRGMWTERRRSVSLEAENQRLREAAQDAVGVWCWRYPHQEDGHNVSMLIEEQQAYEKLRAALAGKGE